jgi:hypothetical protein
MSLFLPVECGLKPLLDQTLSDAQNGIDTAEKLSAILASAQAGPSASAFNRI